jgi:hypothetical protein
MEVIVLILVVAAFALAPFLDPKDYSPTCSLCLAGKGARIRFACNRLSAWSASCRNRRAPKDYSTLV